MSNAIEIWAQNKLRDLSGMLAVNRAFTDKNTKAIQDKTPLEIPIKFQHGDRVSITKKYWRAYDSMDGGRYWDTEAVSATGIFLGYRWLSDGQVHYPGEECIYEGHHTFKAALVSLNARTNPVYVPLDAITPPTEGYAS